MPRRPRHDAVLPTLVVLAMAVALACRVSPRARSERAFDDLAAWVAGRTAGEVADALGEPDSRRPVYLEDERWIWWNYTFLDGHDVPPELRGRVVHLLVTFRRASGPAGEPLPRSHWRVVRPFGVAYQLAGDRGDGDWSAARAGSYP